MSCAVPTMVHPPPQAFVAGQLRVPGLVRVSHALMDYAPTIPFVAHFATPAEVTDTSVVGKPFWQATQLAGCGVTMWVGST